MTVRIFAAFSWLTFLDRFRTRDAVLSETPASRATSTNVGTCVLFTAISQPIRSISLVKPIPTCSFWCGDRAKGCSPGFRIPKQHNANLQDHGQREKEKGANR